MALLALFARFTRVRFRIEPFAQVAPYRPPRRLHRVERLVFKNVFEYFTHVFAVAQNASPVPALPSYGIGVDPRPREADAIGVRGLRGKRPVPVNEETPENPRRPTTMQQRSIAPFSAALLAGALAACPAFAQMQQPDPSTQTATKSETTRGADMYAGVKVAHGPGVIPNDAPRGPAGLATARTTVGVAAPRAATRATVARNSQSDPSTTAATKSENPTGTNMYAGVKIAHGPGVIPNDAPKGPAGLAVNAGVQPAAAPAPAGRGDRYVYGSGYYGADEGGVAVSTGFGPTPAAYGHGYGYEPAWGVSAEPACAAGYGRRCYQRRVMIDQRHAAWRRFCE
ncbi:MAG: hypothetical protein ACTHLO_17645 [Pseudolabrys sp.]